MRRCILSILYIIINPLCIESLEATVSLESELDAPTVRFGELPVLDDQDVFSKTGSVTLDANNYGKVLVNLLLEWLAWIAHMVVIQLFFK